MSKILLVEPDKQMANIISRFLESHDHSVHICASAQAAVHATDTHQPEAVILELQLPVHNGIEFLYELRSYSDWQDLPVIVHSQVPPTAKGVSQMLWDQLGVQAYHYKPLAKLADLQTSLDSLLAKA
jgi:DNA-binding response OmpR family regulator